MSEAFDLHWGRGWNFYKAENFEEAIIEWRVAADLDPEDGYVLNNIGRALSKLGKKEEAITEWRKAVQMEPDYDSLHTNLAYALSANGYSPEALAAVQAAICLSPNDIYLYDHLGFHLLVQADENKDKDGWEAAAAAFQQALDINPTDSYAHQYLAKAQWAGGKKPEAIKTLKDAVVVGPNNIKARIQLSSYQLYTGRFSSAMRTYIAAIRLLETEEGKQHLADSERLMHGVEISLYASAGLAVVLTGV